MSRPNKAKAKPVHLAADLDAGTVVEAHARLLRALEETERKDAAVTLDLEAGDAPVSPLSLQLVVSATRSFPPAQLEIGPRATAVLAALDTSKETQ